MADVPKSKSTPWPDGWPSAMKPSPALERRLREALGADTPDDLIEELAICIAEEKWLGVAKRARVPGRGSTSGDLRKVMKASCALRLALQDKQHFDRETQSPVTVKWLGDLDEHAHAVNPQAWPVGTIFLLRELLPILEEAAEKKPRKNWRPRGNWRRILARQIAEILHRHGRLSTTEYGAFDEVLRVGTLEVGLQELKATPKKLLSETVKAVRQGQKPS